MEPTTSLSSASSEKINTHPEIGNASSASTNNAIDTKTASFKQWMNLRLALNLVIIGLALGLFGYDNAFTSPLLSLPLFVLKYQGAGPGGLPIFTAVNLNKLVPLPIAFAVGGALTAAPLQGKIGRKWSLVAAYAICCVPGSLLQLFAPSLWSLAGGRCWNYLGIGIITNVAPLYLADLVPVHVRGRAVGLTAAGSGALAVIGTVVVWATEKRTTDLQYKIPLAVQVVFPGLLCILSLFLTESPFLLLSKGNHERARQNLVLLRGGNVQLAEAELKMQELAIASSAEQAKSQQKWTNMFNRKNFERSLTASAFISVSQVCGQALAGTYSTVILVQSGVGDAFQITILIFTLQFFGTLVGPFLIDRFGRRPVCLICFTILAIVDLAAGGLACTGLTTLMRQKALAALCIIFAFFNSTSFGTVSFLLPTEIPTASLRAATLSWSFGWSYTTAVITTFVIPQIIAPDAGNLGAKAFLIFGAIMALFIVFTYFFLPETAKRSLAEVDYMYEAKIPKRHWRNFVCPPLDDKVGR